MAATSSLIVRVPVSELHSTLTRRSGRPMARGDHADASQIHSPVRAARSTNPTCHCRGDHREKSSFHRSDQTHDGDENSDGNAQWPPLEGREVTSLEPLQRVSQCDQPASTIETIPMMINAVPMVIAK